MKKYTPFLIIFIVVISILFFSQDVKAQTCVQTCQEAGYDGSVCYVADCSAFGFPTCQQGYCYYNCSDRGATSDCSDRCLCYDVQTCNCPNVDTCENTGCRFITGICAQNYTDSTGETRSAHDWCTDCPDGPYDFCNGNIHYQFGCESGGFMGMACNCDPDNTFSESCAGGCTKWDCTRGAGCSGGSCSAGGCLNRGQACTSNSQCCTNECSSWSGACYDSSLSGGVGASCYDQSECASNACMGPAAPNIPGQCLACPPPQVIPHKECVGSICQSVNTCGVNSCTSDSDCAAGCTPNGCNGNCPSGCTVAQDPDCGCQGGNACCGIGCNNTNDSDCTAGCPAGQVRPHRECSGTTCQSVDSCGVNSCTTNTDCGGGGACTESDNGPNWTQQGDCRENGVVRGTDTCQDTRYLTEWTCVSNTCTALQYDCSQQGEGWTCSNGQCIPPGGPGPGPGPEPISCLESSIDTGSLKTYQVGSQIVAYDGLVPCGKCVLVGNLSMVDSRGNYMGGGTPTYVSCQLCHFFIMIKGIIDFLLFRIVPIIAVLMLIIGGIMFIFSRGNPNTLIQARAIMTATVIGLLIIFVAWLMVNTFFMFMGISSWTGLTGGWFQISCPITL